MAASTSNVSPAKSYELRLVDDKPYVPKPLFADEKAKNMAILGLLPVDAPSEIYTTDEGAFFPTSKDSRLLITSPKPFSLRFYDRNFRTAPPLRCPKFAAWMARLKPSKGKLWEDLGIDTLLNMSQEGISYSHIMLTTALFFWEGSTNTFHTGCGMITPTLLDVAAITGLKPAGPVFNHVDVEVVPVKFDVGETKNPKFNNFLTHHHKDTPDISDEEHVAFLTYWLSRCIFCSRYMQVAKQFVYLASHLHNGEGVALRQLILANLYMSLTNVA
ncbi:uncharacterized protein LOC131598377 [Vicia villosa]|uniref:uncharacterized protein LOC131598377 n=1 Tax=Vicia villosa TaxID=3911 RepID=UPI00273AC702|nr:uncharacterized protein LOC131598377 [Vicia villosa]